MAGDWIAMGAHLWDCPEVVEILSAFCPQNVHDLSARNRHKCEIIGALFKTWTLFDTHSEDGVLQGYNETQLNQEVGIEGWAENLRHVGWLEIREQSIAMPDFSDWMIDSSKRRLKDAKRKRNARKNASAKCPQNVRTPADKMRTTGQDRTVVSKDKSLDTGERAKTSRASGGVAKKKVRMFTPPTREQVVSYASSLGYRLDVDKFLAHYETNGWMAGKSKMRSWEAAVRNWKANGWGELSGNGQAEDLLLPRDERVGF